MSTEHTGNLLNSITFEEHDGFLNAKKISLISAATIYAVVNTGTPGVTNSIVTVANFPATFGGNVTLDPGSFTGIKGNITLDDGSLTGIVGNLTLSDSKGFIGLTTVVQASSVRSLAGNVTLSDSKGYIGLTTSTLGIGTQFIGLVTVVQSSAVRSLAGNVTLDDGSLTGIVGNLTLSDSKGFIGLVSVLGSVGIVGNVTALVQNAGTNKSLDWRPVTLSTASISTLFTPTNANRVFTTNVILNSDATVRVSIKSGVTYLTGNASIGITLNPGGGWVETGSPDSPTYIGCASGPLVVEKFDMTGVKANLSGKIVFFQEA